MKTIFNEMEIEIWINAHWLSAPMLTKGMAEQVIAIERQLTSDVTE